MDTDRNPHYETRYDGSLTIFNNQKKIRVGIMLDDLRIEYWVYKILEDIASSYYASLELVVVNKNRDGNPSEPGKSREERKNLFYYAWTRWENRIHRPQPDAFSPADTQKILGNVPLIEIQPHRGKHSDRIEGEDIERIEKFSPDVILQFGSRILKGDILKAARYGIWSYYHGDTTVLRGGPPGFWETFGRMGERGVILQRLTEDPCNGVELYRSFLPLQSLFINENNNNCYLKSSLFVPRTLKKLFHEGEDAFFADRERESKKLVFYNQVNYSAPTNGAFSRMVIPHLLPDGCRVCIPPFCSEPVGADV